jgi:WD40 repeat protein
MHRWFLSYNSQDLRMAQRLDADLKRKNPDCKVFLAAKTLRAGGYWLPELAKEIADATAFVLLVGENKVGPWQVMEYYEALDRRVKQPDFPIVLVLLEGQPAPGLPFLRQLHWIVTQHPAGEDTIARLVDATSLPATRPGELWRHTAPYRGLAAMTEADSEFFFGRGLETVGVLRSLAAASDKLPILVGNSGVGKSSLAQAGVLAALSRQAWPETAGETGAWPDIFSDSRRWCFLTMRPGEEPVKSLVEAFLETWQLDRTSTDWPLRRAEWVDGLVAGRLTCRDLLDQTGRRYAELEHPRPPAFLLYVDQGEELYVRSEPHQRGRFSELLAHGLGDPRLRALMSLRADFSGALQNDQPLFEIQHRIEVPPLREAQLRQVVSRPAELLSVRFENEHLALDIARRTAEESAIGAGALPLLSYLLDDMWTAMIERGDGVLRSPVLDAGSVLAHRANSFLSRHPDSEAALKRLLTLKLATVREDGEPTRRRAARSEFSDSDWQLVRELADHPNRLLVVSTLDNDEVYAEVAHEAIFRHWQALREWVAGEREFLAWRSGLDAELRRWESASTSERDEALLSGFALAQAQRWIATRAEDLARPQRDFIVASVTRESLERARRGRERAQRDLLRRLLLWGSAAALILVTAFAGFAGYQWFRVNEKQQGLESALHAQSRGLADLANQHASKGDAGTAILLAIEALPDRSGLTRPYAFEAEAALFNARQSLREISIKSYRAWGAKLSPDGRRLLTVSSEDASAKLWELESGRLVSVFSGHFGGVSDASFSPDGRRVVTSSSDHTARVWEAETGRIIAELLGHENIILKAVFSPDGRQVVTASGDKTARVWDVESGNEIRILRGHEEGVMAASFSPDGRLLVTAALDASARLWEADSGREVRVLKPSDKREFGLTAIYGAEFSPDGRSLITASSDNTARLWEVESGREIHVFRGHEGPVNRAAFSADGREIVTASDDGTARIWEVEFGYEQTVLRGHDGKVYSAAFSPDGRQVFTLGSDGTVRFWNAEKSAPGTVLKGHDAGAWSGAFSPNGRLALTTSGDQTGRLWDVKTGGTIFVFKGDDEGVSKASFSADGRRIVTASSAATARLWDTETGRTIYVLRGHDQAVLDVAFSSNGRRVVTASRDGTARLWDSENGQEVKALRGHTSEVGSATFSPDDRQVVTASNDGTARVWDAETGQEIQVLRGHEGHVSRATFSADGRRVMTMSLDGTVRVWNAASGAQVFMLTGYHGAFSPDGKRIVTADSKAVRLWNADSGVEIFVLKHDVGSAMPVVLHAAFSPDGLRVVTAGGSVARLWDVATGRELGRLLGHDSFALDGRLLTNSVSGAVFSPDGRLVLTVSGDGTARIWDVFPAVQDLIDSAKRAVPRCLTQARREGAFLDPAPPAWCIEMEKWPYNTTRWRKWLGDQKAGKQVEMPRN